MPCGPEKVEIAPGVFRLKAHGMGNLAVCAEDPSQPRGGAISDVAAMSFNLRHAINKVGPEGVAKALQGAGQGLITGSQTKPTPQLVEQALRSAAGVNLIRGTNESPVSILGADNLANAIRQASSSSIATQALNRGVSVDQLFNTIGNGAASGPVYGPNAGDYFKMANTGFSQFNGGSPLTSPLSGFSQYTGPQATIYSSFLPGESYGSNGYNQTGYSGSFGTGGFSGAYSSGVQTDDSGLGGLGGLGGLLAGGALAYGLGSLFGDSDQKVSTTTNLPPMSPQEMQLLGINVDLARSQLDSYRQAQSLQGTQNPLLNALFREQLGQVELSPEEIQGARSACDAQFPNNFGASAHCQQSLQNLRTQQKISERQQKLQTEEDQRVGRLGQLNTQQDQLGSLALDDAQTGTRELRPDQLARIRGASDLTIQAGLSDIGRFRDEGLNQIRLNSASRGLRPGDTPIQNDFHDLATDAQRTATNFVSGINAQRLNTELQLPFQESALRNQSLGLASDLALRRSALEESLRESARNARLGLASNAQATGLGLATGLNPASAFGALTSARASSGTTTQRQSGGFGQAATLLGGIGGLAQGIGALYG